MKTRTVLLGAAAALSITGSAQASGWYVGAEGGFNWPDDADAVATVLGVTTTGTVSFDGGWTLMATAGNAFASGWRVEGELGFRQNDTTASVGELSEWSLMLNVLYDFKLSPEIKLSLGGGLGADQSTFDAGGVSSDSDTNFAFQTLLGLGYAVTPGTDLTLTYRALGVIEPSYQFGGAASVEFDYLIERSLTVGVRWQLSQGSE